MNHPAKRIAALLALVLAGASCDPSTSYYRVTILGDSHSDVDLVPRLDWIAFKPPDWTIDEHAQSGGKCWKVVPEALASAGTLTGRGFVVFCGTNDAADAAWDLATTVAWIEAAIDHATARGRDIVVVAPPPAFRNVPIPSTVWNDRLALLRDAIYELQATWDFEVADVWAEVWAHPDPPSLYVDNLHLTEPGRVLAAQTIEAAVLRAH